jgi:hypothetical protein
LIFPVNATMNPALPPIPADQTVTPGLYEHYKGMRYEVLGTARHSETLEPLAVYRALYGDFGLWVRPAAMFLEAVNTDEICRKRFVFIGDKA